MMLRAHVNLVSARNIDQELRCLLLMVGYAIDEASLQGDEG